MKDWPELVLGLIEDLKQYVKWLDDFKEDATPEACGLITEDQVVVIDLIKGLQNHEVDKANPELLALMQWDHRFQRPS